MYMYIDQRDTSKKKATHQALPSGTHTLTYTQHTHTHNTISRTRIQQTAYQVRDRWQLLAAVGILGDLLDGADTVVRSPTISQACENMPQLRGHTRAAQLT